MDLSINFNKNLIEDYIQEKEEKPTATLEKNDKKSLQKKFLLSAKNLYLTYSKCFLELSVILEILKLRLSSYIVLDYVLVRESNETRGKLDIHTYLKLAKKTNIVSESFLDLIINGNVNRGDYRTAKHPNSIIEDILKYTGSKYDKNLLFSSTMDHLLDELGKFKNFYSLLIELAEQGNVQEAMSLLKRINPELYIKQAKTIENRLNDIFKKS